MSFKEKIEIIRELGFRESMIRKANGYVARGVIKGRLGVLIVLKTCKLNAVKKLDKSVKGKAVELSKTISEVEIAYLPCSNRVGEFISRFLMACRDDEEKPGKDGVLRLFIIDNNENVNRFLLNVMCRRLNIITEFNFDYWNCVIKNKKVKIDYNSYLIRKDFGKLFLSEDCKKDFRISKKEKERFEKYRKEYGVHEEYVCISNRDSAYLEKTNGGVDCSYHDFRDSDISSLDLAVDYLGNVGLQSVRMGRIVSKRADFDNCVEFVSDHYNEFMDIMLHRNCMFEVMDGAGINLIPLSQGVPVAYKNIIPAFAGGWEVIPHNCQDIMIFKKLYDRNKDRYLSILEMLEFEVIYLKDLFNKETYFDNGIGFVDNSHEEIRDLVEEMYLRLKGEWREDSEISLFNEKLQVLLDEHAIKCGVDRTYITSARIGTKFLKDNPYLMKGIV